MTFSNKLVTFAILVSGLAWVWMPTTSLAAEEALHWSYDGEEGPDHWGELSEKYIMCSQGRNQSPIDLSLAVRAELPELQFEYYSDSIVNEVNNGHTIQQNVRPGSFLKIPSRNLSVELKQYHFHSPSEHTINGESFAMEIHFVHADEAGNLTVVGVLMKEGEEHPVLSKLWSFMPEKPGDTREEAVGIEETNLLPPTREYFSYGGSLTTPPCSEGVKWFVLKTPVEASAEQIAVFKDRVGEFTNRPVQPHNARFIAN